MKKVKIIIVSVMMLLLAVGFVFRVVQVNSRYPAAEEVRVNRSESIDFNGITYQVTDFRFMTDEELETYQANVLNPIRTVSHGETQAYKCALVEVKALNTTQQEQSARFTYFCLQSGTWRNGIDLNTLMNYDKEGGLYYQLPPGKSVTQILAFSFSTRQFKNDRLWQDVEKRNYELVLSLYPVKRVIELS